MNKNLINKTGQTKKIVRDINGVVKKPTSNIKKAGFSNKTKTATTLNRQFVKKPSFDVKSQPKIIHRANTKPRNIQNRINQNSKIKHFNSLDQAKKLNSKQPVVLSETINSQKVISVKEQQKFQNDFKTAKKANFYTRHKINQIIRERRRQQDLLFNKKQQTVTTNSKSLTEIKNETLTRAIAQAPSSKQLALNKPKIKGPNFFKRNKNYFLFLLIALFISGGLVYLNLPNLAMHQASLNAQISGQYPSYLPDDFKLKQAANFKANRINFSYFNGTQEIIFQQSKTDWTPQTLVDSVIEPAVGNDYQTSTMKGLKVYLFNQKVVWINGGILYQIEYNFPLDQDQVFNIINSF